MGSMRQQGFTIIEVVLFLGISGLLAVTLLSGWTVMIDTQRYQDSVKSLQSFLQQQYNLVYNVENGRGQGLTCSSSGVQNPGGTNGIPRGQTNCFMMGRYISIQNGTNLQVFPIVGIRTSTTEPTNDLVSITDSAPQRVVPNTGISESEQVIPWGARVVGTGGDNNARTYAIAIIRTPSSGTVHTFVQATSSGSYPSLAQLTVAANESGDTNLCLDGGAPITGGRLGVVIKARASTQNYVQTIPEAGPC